jgi:serine/threonine-protein kinase RsbT
MMQKTGNIRYELKKVAIEPKESTLFKARIYDEVDVALVVMEAMRCSKDFGFSKPEQYKISTAVSELARNSVLHAGSGEVTLNGLAENGKNGIEIIVEDEGPGIQDIDKALENNFSTAGTLGLGLPGAKRLMDQLNIEIKMPRGSKIIARKWLK